MKGFHKVFLICVVIMQGCGGSKTDNNCNDCDSVAPSTQTEETTFTLDGRVAPPLAGSTVFIDLNRDNLQGTNEPVTTTDKAGFFSLTVPTGTTGKIVARGGEDISTRVAMPELTLVAEIPSDTSELTLLTPLSTLTFGLLTSEKQALFGTFDIENDIVIVSGKDHWDLAQKDDISAKAIQRINQKVNILMQTAISICQALNPSSANEASLAAAGVIAEMATSNSLSHSNPESVSLILQKTSSILAPNAPLSMEYADEIAVPISLLKRNLDNYNINPTSDALTPVLGVSQRDLQALIVRLIKKEISVEDFIKATDPVNLFSSIDLPPGFENDDGSINEAPAIGDQTFNIRENSTAVGTVVANDPDEDTLTYTLEGTDANDFLITSGSGALRFKNAPNFEHKHSYSVDVKVSDNGNPSRSTTATITVNVTDENEAPEIANQTFDVSENQTTIDTVSASDADAGDDPTYSIVKGKDASAFSIDSNSGELSFNTSPNFEDKNSYSLDVKVSDRDDPFLSNTAKITVNVTDENEAPIIFNQTFDAPEEQTAINTVFASDPDAGNILTYALQGTDASLFDIDPFSGVLSFRTKPNYESSDQKKTYSVNVKVTDSHDQPISSNATITVNITDINEAPRISNQTFNVAENQTGVGTVIAQDHDIGDTLTYTLAGTDANAFDIDSGNGALSFKTAPNYEEKNNYSIAVKVTDSGSPSLSNTASITINLTGLNEAPDIADQTLTAAENQTDVGPVVASDPDADESLTYSITGGSDASLFSIDNSGVLSFINAPNFEDKNNFSIDVTVTDSGSPSLSNTATITITVTDVNEAPVIADQRLNIQENLKDIGTVVASDPDRGDILEYSLSGEDAGHLSIDESGNLSFLIAPDYETSQRVYKANVQVTDNGSSSLSATAEISVHVFNLNEPPIVEDQTFIMSENQTTVGNVIADEPDAYQYPLYTISGGRDSSYFNIGYYSGILSFRQPPDFENSDKNSYTVRVKVADGIYGGFLYAYADMTVNVVDVNEPPQISNQTFSVSQNETTVGNVSASDPDANDTLSYTIEGGADASLFNIIDSSGALSFKAAPSSNAKETYTVNIKVTDGAEPSLSKTATITVNISDFNEAPTISNQTFNVSENKTAVGNVVAQDTNAGDILTYAVEGTDANAFNIGSSSGALSFRTVPNFEDKATYSINVKVTDNGSPSLSNTATITINVTDVNETPVISDQTFSVSENQTTVGNVSANDPDADESLTYSIVGGSNASLFSIDNSGVLSFKAAPDFENKNNFSIDVTVTDSGSPSLSNTATITINVTDENDSPEIANQTFSVSQNQTAVGTVSASDPDANDTLSYTIEGGADASLFNIDLTNGYLSFKTAPSSNAKETYTVNVKVTDGGEPSLSKTATITVNISDFNEAPTISNQTFNVSENETTIGTVSASDPNANDTLTYSITEGTDANAFNIGSSSGALSFRAAPNFEDKATYSINVKVTDNGSPSSSKTATITINVTDVNEEPVISDQTFSVSENQTTVGNVIADDPDTDKTLTYSIVGGSDASLFNIIENSGVLSFKTAPDFEDKNSYSIDVKVTDSGSPSLSHTATITVNVTDENESPEIANQTFSVSQNQTAVGTVSASDPDANDTMTYSITGGADASLFDIIDSSGVLSFKTAPNTDAKETYTVNINVTDGGEPSLSKTATITVNISDFNEAPTISNQTFNVSENETTIGTVSASDPNANDTLTYSITEGTDANAFNIGSSSGALSFRAAPNFEDKATYSINVKVTDNGSPSSSKTATITINVTDVNEEPVISDQTFSVSENQTTVGNVIADDPDTDKTLTYSIVGGSDASLFNIIENSGVLSFKAAPDFEDKNSYSIDVKVTDSGSPSLSHTATITVNVTDILEVDIDFLKTSPGHNNESFYKLYKNASLVMEAQVSGQEVPDITQAVFSIEDSTGNIIKPIINFIEIKNSQSNATLNKYIVELSAIGLEAQTSYRLNMSLVLKDKNPASKKVNVVMDDSDFTRINGIAKVTNDTTEINLAGLSNASELYVFGSTCPNKLEHIFSDAVNCDHQIIEPNGSTFSLTDKIEMKQLILKNGDYLSQVGLPFPVFNNHDLVVFKEKLWIFSNNQIWSSSDGFTWQQVNKEMDFAANKRMDYRVVVFQDALWVLGGYSYIGSEKIQHQDVWKSKDGITWNQVTAEANFNSITNPELLTHRYGDEEEKIWMIGEGGIWNSSNGESWQQIPPPETIDLRYNRTQALVDNNGNLQLVGNSTNQGPDPIVEGYKYAGNNQWHAQTPSVGPNKQDRLMVFLGGHEAINFKGDAWVVGGSCHEAFREEYGENRYNFDDCNYLHKLNGSFTSGYWQHVNVEETSKKAISRRVNPRMVVFDEKLWISDSTHSNHWGGASYSADGQAWFETNDSMVRPPNSTDHQVVHFKDKMWSIGGSTRGAFNTLHPVASLEKAIWKSEDGINWEQIQNQSPFTARRGHQAVVFNDHLWLIGGNDGECKTNNYGCSDYQTNDIWKSSDGINWQQIKDNADFTIREGHQVKLFNGALWLIGGHSQNQYNNEIWKSNNGEDWEQVQITDSNSSFSARSGHQLVVFDSHLWLIGGFDGRDYKNDIWKSYNGEDWQKVTTTSSSTYIFSPRAEHQVSVLDGKLWLTGGKNTDGVVADDIWFSNDGINWEQYQSSLKPSPKEGHQMLTFNHEGQDQLRLIGGAAGTDESSDGALDEIWSYQLSDEQWTRYMHITTPYSLGLQ